MAKRISVVLSQSPNANATRRAVEEELVTQLLMEYGVDVNLVPHLPTLEPGDTGFLCLEGIKRDMILLSWLDSAEAHQLLRHKNVIGRFGRTRTGSGHHSEAQILGSSPQTHRTIYHVDLRVHTSARPYCEEIMRIREETSIQTFEISIPSKKSSGGESPISPVVQVAPGRQDSASAHLVGSPDDNLRADKTDVGDSRKTTDSDQQPSDVDDAIEALVDQLDSWDL